MPPKKSKAEEAEEKLRAEKAAKADELAREQYKLEQEEKKRREQEEKKLKEEMFKDWSDVSSDEDPMESTLLHSQRMKEKYENEEKPFSFYDFGKSETPFEDLLDEITQLKSLYHTDCLNRTLKFTQTLTSLPTQKKKSTRLCIQEMLDEEDELKERLNTLAERTSNFNPEWGCATLSTKTFDIEKYQQENYYKRKDSKNYRISQFRTSEPKWKGVSLNTELVKSLQRIPVPDTSGVRVSLERDNKPAPGSDPWVPPQSCRKIPDPKFHAGEITKQQVMKNLDRAIEKVQKEYDSMKPRTIREQTIHAQIGADLKSLKQTRDILYSQLNQEKTK